MAMKGKTDGLSVDEQRLIDAAKERLCRFIQECRGATSVDDRNARLSQRQFAAQINLNPNSIRAYEAKEVDPGDIY